MDSTWGGGTESVGESEGLTHQGNQKFKKISCHSKIFTEIHKHIFLYSFTNAKNLCYLANTPTRIYAIYF